MQIEKVSDNHILYIDDTIRIEYKKGKLIFLNNKYEKKIWEYCLTISKRSSLLASFFLTERLLRCEPRYIIRWSEYDFLVSYNGVLCRLNINNKTGIPITKYANGTRNPLHFCLYDRAGRKELVYGDYGGHDSEGNIGIYMYSNDGIKQITSFSGESIDHIHRVEYDSIRDRYWIFTGDTDKASGIWYIEYGGSAIHPFLVGQQQYRACVAFIENDRIIYATDSPLEANHVYSVNVYDRKIRMLYDLPGPCIYGRCIDTLQECIYCFSTSVEPDSTLPVYRYFITYKLGGGVTDWYSHVFIYDKKNKFKEIWKLKKDVFPMCLFQFGNHRFPTQFITGKVYFCPQSCKNGSGTYRYILDS